MRAVTFIVFSPLLPALVAGCVATSPLSVSVGDSKSEVVRQLGKPMRETALAYGERLDYSRGPDGLNTYFVYLDNEGRMSRVEQSLTDTNFSRIQAGMSQAQVIEILGDPPKRHQIGRERGYVWSYRSFSTVCNWFQIEFTPEDIVRSADYNRRPAGIPCR